MMQRNSQIPDLTFPDVSLGPKETPWTLEVLLYIGGAAAKKDLAGKLISNGTLPGPQFDRMELVVRLHEAINGPLSSGGSQLTASDQITMLRKFVAFADRTGMPLTVDGVTKTYCAWTDFLVHRTRISKRARKDPQHRRRDTLSMRAAYFYGSVVGALLNTALARHTHILELTKLESPKHRKTAVGTQAEKQLLAVTFAFGHLLQDICDGLPLQTILEAALPVRVSLRTGDTISCEGDKAGHSQMRQEVDLGERYALVNLRIEAELLMFIGQTGMNLSQASNLALRHFSYVSYLNGYQVKEYKRRRKGSVLFEIFKEYRDHFERYLEWRRRLFPRSTRLFPFVRRPATREDVKVVFYRLRQACRELNVAFIPPRSLRNTRVNWLLRKTADPSITAEMDQHTKETLLGTYERPSVQRASVEAARFWSKVDDGLAKTQSVAPGGCTGSPSPLPNIPKNISDPDCSAPSGCLWCLNHRDVDSLDYVWALASFQHLKVVEMSKAPLPKRQEDIPPAQHAISRIHEKLAWFEESTERRQAWVHEARALIVEGNFHHHFLEEITAFETTS